MPQRTVSGFKRTLTSWKSEDFQEAEAKSFSCVRKIKGINIVYAKRILMAHKLNMSQQYDAVAEKANMV